MKRETVEKVLQNWPTLNVFNKSDWSILTINNVNFNTDNVTISVLKNREAVVRIEEDDSDEHFDYFLVSTLLKPSVKLFYEDPITGDTIESGEIDPVDISKVYTEWSESETIEIEKENMQC